MPTSATRPIRARHWSAVVATFGMTLAAAGIASAEEGSGREYPVDDLSGVLERLERVEAELRATRVELDEARERERAREARRVAAEDELAIERDGQGLFTTYLVRALRGEADFDGDGVVTAGEIGVFVWPQVSAASDNRQTPQFGTLAGTGEVVFPLP